MCSLWSPHAEASRRLWRSTLESAPSTLESAGGGDAPGAEGNTGNAKPRGREPLGTSPGPPLQPLKSQVSKSKKGRCASCGTGLFLPETWRQAKHGLCCASHQECLGMDGKRSPSPGQAMPKQPWIHIPYRHRTICAGGT